MQEEHEVKAKRSISGRILFNTDLMMICLAVVFVVLMTRSMKSLTDSVLSDVLPSMTKTASQNLEGNLHMLSDRIFMIGENEAITDPGGSQEGKLSVLENAQSGIEFAWLGLYNAEGSLYLGDEKCPASLKERKLFPLLQETQNMVIDDIFENGDVLELAVGLPIFNTEGELNYYLVGSYNYDILSDVLSSINISANGEAFIVNADGRIMGHRNTDLVREQTDMAEYVGTDVIENKVVSGETGIMTYEYKKDTELISYVPINGTDWYLAIIVPRSDFMGPANDSILLGIYITLGILLVAGIYTVAYASRIKNSLKGVTNRIELLANGDLKTPTKISRTKDETQVLSASLSNTVNSINGYISELSKILSSISEGDFDVSVEGEFHGDFVIMKESLNSIIVSLSQMLMSVQDSSKQVLETAGIVSESAVQVHTGSSEQSSSLMVLTEETKAIEENISEVDNNTRMAGELMEKAKTSMDAGDANMKNLLKAMEDINNNSLEITKVNRILENIAAQTNMLALNASVEASRAGEFGKGFAVVASEVRELAAQSTDSAKHASEVINSSLKAIENGVIYAKQAAESFDDINEVTSKMTDITKRLEESVSVQKESLANMSDQIAQISNVAQRNLDSSYESTTASQKLHKQAEGLQNISGQFRLRRDK
ncbi:methyl-accepting chemotaxis protein [Petralouisia muris]|uniref:Methyl-accepting chemotaxis protein n=1 Tax=Petralouisia muris TaxID=3032872 RepID=A0AC61RTN6_9FIRM|nr:methyl-accepting chemotaxis protein [Petralouisia muris]